MFCSIAFSETSYDYSCEAYDQRDEYLCNGLDYHACVTYKRTCYVEKDSMVKTDLKLDL